MQRYVGVSYGENKWNSKYTLWLRKIKEKKREILKQVNVEGTTEKENVLKYMPKWKSPGLDLFQSFLAEEFHCFDR